MPSPFSFTPAVIFPLCAVLQTLQTIAVLQLRPSHNSNAVRYLQGLLLVCALLLTDYSLVISGFYQQSPALAGFSLPFLFSLGPLLLAYVQCLLGKQLRWQYCMHFSAVPLCWIVLMPLYLAESNTKAEFFRVLLSNGFQGAVFMSLLVCLLLSLHLVLYCYCAYEELEQYDKALQEQTAGDAVQIVQWLKLVSRGFCLFQITFYLAWAEWLYLHPERWHYSFAAMYSLALLLVLIGLWCQLRPELFFRTTLAELPHLPQLESTEEKYAKTRLDPVQLAELTAQLELHMQSSRPFLDPELRLPVLAGQVQMTPHLLSQVINQGLACNYFEYINRQRIRFAQTLLEVESLQKPNLLKIALEAGFNSKATFNRSFRHETGSSPSDYLARLKNTAVHQSVNR